MIQEKMNPAGEKQEHITALKALAQNILDALSQGSVDQCVNLCQRALKEGLGTPQEIGHVLGRVTSALYDNFLVMPVEEFYKKIHPVLLPESMAILISHLEKRISFTHEWEAKIENLYVERLAREIREAINAKSLNEALQRCKTLLLSGKTPDATLHMANLLGNVFGTLENVQDQVDKVTEMLRHFVVPDVIAIIERAKKERLALMYKSELEQRNIEWTRNLSVTVAEMKRHLPLSTMMASEPTRGDLDQFDLLVRSIIRCSLLPSHDRYFPDIINLLLEFCPREVSSAGASSGMESRLFNALTPYQKRVVIDVLSQLGKNKTLATEIIQFAEANKGSRYHQYSVEVLGALKSEATVDYFIRCLEDKKQSAVHPEAISALGSLSHESARKALLDLLANALKVKTIVPMDRERITHILSALAKISRNKNTTRKSRNVLIHDVIHLLGERDIRLNLFCAENFFLVRLEEIDPRLRSWAVRRLVEGLWLKDTTPEFARGPKAGESSDHTILGARERLVDLLVQQGPGLLPDMINAAERHLFQYSGAYMALGEVMAKVGDMRAVPILEKLLTATMVMDEARLGKYQKEHIWNVAEEARQTLDKDKIAHSLVYALNSIGGEQADKALAELSEKIQKGEYTLPGKETMEILFKVQQRLGILRDTAEGSVFVESRERKIPFVEVEDAIHALEKKYLFANGEKKRLKKVSALQLLGKARDPAALAPVISHLEDKDPLISSAAITALVEYNSPPMKVENLTSFLHILGEAWHRAPREGKKRIETILAKLQPEREIMKSRLRQAIEKVRSHKIKYFLEKFFNAQIAPRVETKTEFDTPFEEKRGGNDQKAEDKASIPAAMSVLEQKRLFMEARKKWLAGGKKGDPPKREDFVKK